MSLLVLKITPALYHNGTEPALHHNGTRPVKFFAIPLIFLFIFGLVTVQPLQAQFVDTAVVEEVNMVIGELETLQVYALTRASITNPGVADIVEYGDTEIVIIAKQVGQTSIFIWDELDKRSVLINVAAQTLDLVKTRMEDLFDAATIYEAEIAINDNEHKVVITGDIPLHKMGQFKNIVESFEGQTIDLTREDKSEDLIEVDIQITELNQTLTKSLGVEWFATGGSVTLTDTGAGGFLNPLYVEELPTFDGSIGDFFKIGDFSRTSQIVAKVNALLDEGKARLLSNPKLVVISGEEASFLIGGEIPIRTTTAAENTVQENVTFKEYGIGMTITPTIRKGKIDVLLLAEVSDIDAANKVGDDVAFTSRTAQTSLYLDDGQTIVLAGLIKERESETVRKVPFLGDIPIIGLLFRARFTPVPNEDQEIVIMLTPRILTDRKSEFAKMEVERKKGKIVPDQLHQRNRMPMPSYLEFEPSVTVLPQGMDSYIQMVKKQIAQSIIYPREAQEYGWEGTVKLGLLILNDGTLAFASIKESSGYDIFDNIALNSVKKTAPFSIFPSGSDLQELDVIIPIVYSLKP